MKDLSRANAVVSASALVTNDANELLIVKPRREDAWDLPGGLMSQESDPVDTCIREVSEETGLVVSIERLLVIDWAPRADQGKKILYIFHAACRDRSTQQPISRDPDEITDLKYVEPGHALTMMSERVRRRAALALEALESGDWYYLVDGCVPPYATRTLR